MSSPARSPWLAGLLSAAVPGLGHLYTGDGPTGWSLVCITAGLALTYATTRSPLTRALLGLVYLAVLVPAVLDAAQAARGRRPASGGHAAWYVVAMLAAAGPFALPLLWTSPHFSRAAKIGWTLAVLLIAAAFLLTLAAAGPLLERLAPPLLRP